MIEKIDSSTKCSICHEEGDGFHFGAEACRACAAFFRRSVSTAKQYVCRADGRCLIRPDIRCMCRACRFSKCLQVGMNPAGVQQRRDNIGKRRFSQISAESLPLNHEEPSSSSQVPSFETMPILEKMRLNYIQLESSRAVIHRREGESIIMPRLPRNVTCRESALVIEREVSLVADWVSCCFEDFKHLPCDQKQVLFRNFFLNFIMLQYSYSCHVHNRDDVIIIASGDFIDLNNLEYFYKKYDDFEGSPMISSEEAAKLFRPSFQLFRKSMIQQMMQQNVDAYEFFALCTCILWDFGLDGQTEMCTEICRNIKERVLKELLFYLRNVRKIENPSIRMATLITMIPSLNRSTKKFQENVEISNVFKICAVPSRFYEIISGKFL